MKKAVLILSFLLMLSVIACLWLYSSASRFTIANVGGGKLYKIDRRSGESWLLVGRKEYPVEPHEATDETKDQKAIRLGKNDRSLDLGDYSILGNNERKIMEYLRKSTGPLRVIGWKARAIDDQTYLVSYTFDRSEGVEGFFLEVNIEAEVVRKVSGDAELEAKYEIGTGGRN